jgi:class 3 adenylate cyclase
VRKYFIAFFAAVALPLLVNASIDALLSYRTQRASLDALLRLEAQSAADRIQGFLDGIRDQLEWAVQFAWVEGDDERHRLDALRILRQAPAVINLTLVDGKGIERFFLSRVGLNRVGSGIEMTDEPPVRGARSEGIWYGPVTFNRGSEPVMTVALAGSRASAGTVVATINLKLILDVISGIRVGKTGRAFLLDRDARLIAHPDLSIVLRGDHLDPADSHRLARALAAQQGRAVRARDPEGLDVLAAGATIGSVNWTAIAAQPTAEAFEPMFNALWGTAVLIGAGAAFAAGLALLLSRRMTGPIRLLEQGVERIGAGDFRHRIALSTGDELERLARRVNAMAAELAMSQEHSERVARLRRFLPPPVAELVEQADDHLLDSRRAEVAVVFGDLRGFTAFSSKAEPEAVMALLREYYEAVGGIVLRYEATLTNLAGDGVMILVNAPLACPDPATKAVSMALEMQAVVQAMAHRWRTSGYDVGFGVGVAFGEATVGRIDTGARLDYTAIGSVVNLAARLCHSADDGDVLLEPIVAAAVSSKTELKRLGTRTFKGIESPFVVYRATTRQ